MTFGSSEILKSCKAQTHRGVHGGLDFVMLQRAGGCNEHPTMNNDDIAPR